MSALGDGHPYADLDGAHRFDIARTHLRIAFELLECDSEATKEIKDAKFAARHSIRSAYRSLVIGEALDKIGDLL